MVAAVGLQNQARSVHVPDAALLSDRNGKTTFTDIDASVLSSLGIL